MRTPERLTRRQAEVLELIRQGLTGEQIADRLGISRSGVIWHETQILARSGSANIRHALCFYYRAELRPEYAPLERKDR